MTLLSIIMAIILVLVAAVNKAYWACMKDFDDAIAHIEKEA